MFYVGQKVVCVDAERPKMFRWSKDHLTKNAVYTVRKVGMITGGGSSGICLHEVMLWTDSPFNQRRFRPIVEKKTDISIFTEILNHKSFTDKVPEKVGR